MIYNAITLFAGCGGLSGEACFGNGLAVDYIKSLHCGESSMPENGIALRTDLSVSFASGEFFFNNDYQIMVHPESASGKLKNLTFRQIMIPQNSFFRFCRESLKYHRYLYFGSFLDYSLKLVEDGR